MTPQLDYLIDFERFYLPTQTKVAVIEIKMQELYKVESL